MTTKNLFTMQPLDLPTKLLENIPENTMVLLHGKPYTDNVQVFLSIGFLNKSGDLAEKIGTYVNGRRWAVLTRNDGHYIEVEVPEDDNTPKEAKDAKS